MSASQEKRSSTPTQLSTGAIAGIAVSIALIVILPPLLIACGFRIRRPKWRTKIATTGLKANQSKAATGGSLGGQPRKAKLEIGGYTIRLERLHDRAKPEPEGSRPQKAKQKALPIESATSLGSQLWRAELEDGEYTRRLERLHNGAKPELDGTRPQKAWWRASSIRPARSQPRPVPAELGTEPVTPGLYELPAGNPVP